MRSLKGILFIVGLFVLAALLIEWDPLKFGAFDSDSFAPALYILPSVIIGILVYKKNK